MANYDFVTPYDAAMAQWLKEQGYPHPIVRASNRFPAKEEIQQAIAKTGSLEVQDAEAREFFAVKKGTERGKGYETRVGCSDWDRLGQSSKDSITMHGSFRAELLIVEMLSHRCGQLLLYPDTGDPAVIVEPGMDVDRVFRLWKEATARADSWEHFFANAGY